MGMEIKFIELGNLGVEVMALDIFMKLELLGMDSLKREPTQS